MSHTSPSRGARRRSVTWLEKVTAADLVEIDTAAAAIMIEGERYPAHILATTGL